MLDQFIQWYSNINQSKNRETYAPHKPLAILFALSGVLHGKRWISYNEDREKLEELIGNFTKFQSKPNCLQPLWRLTNDSKKLPFWTTQPTDLLVNASGDIPASQAREKNFQAGFSTEVYQWLAQDKKISQFLIGEIIEDNFPETLHETILEILNIFELKPEIETQEYVESKIVKVKRDPHFPKKILQLYDNRCSFCGLKIYLNHSPLSMEAAHIKWKARGGECDEYNGLSLCPTHHYTFDRGLWTLKDDYTIDISQNALIDSKSDVFFSPFIGRSIADYILDLTLLPDVGNIRWHHENILK